MARIWVFCGCPGGDRARQREKGGNVEYVRRYKFSVAVSDEHQFWPYEGEFWRDELGTYSYTLTKGCKEGPAARPAAAAR